jgi:hypothetical protein
VCVIPLNDPPSTFAGAFDGSGVLAGAVVAGTGGGFTNAALATFTGTVSTCGKGGAVLHIAGQTGSDVEWEIVEGFGKGELAKLSGHGTSSSGADASGASTWTGTVDCGD